MWVAYVDEALRDLPGAPGRAFTCWAVFESRGTVGDARDREIVQAMRVRQAIRPGFRADHAGPLGEPLLWLPDAVAGAVRASYDGDPSYLDVMRPRVELHVVDLD